MPQWAVRNEDIRNMLNRLGVTIPLGSVPPDARRACVEQLVRAGYSELWTAETAGADAFGPLLLPNQCSKTRLGTAVASGFARGPGLLAMHAAVLANAAPGRVAIGVGASSTPMSTVWHDRAYERPVDRVADTLRFLRAVFAGEKVTATFDTFAVRGFRLDAPPTVAPKLLVGALRPRMLSVASELADGVVLNWLGDDDLATVLPHVRSGSGGPEVVARIFVVPCPDTPRAREAVRPFLARYLAVPAYAAFHRWLGRTGSWTISQRRLDGGTSRRLRRRSLTSSTTLSLWRPRQ